ncbi:MULTISPECIES: hypothetical protein [unclassified Arthrobacter]|uniref:hypothetical protein n=1 Tax=unclassified Arthrobacter TaxID=235627 RepID=UPI001F37077F|nr:MULTISPECIES: hypothetical protein [unclassified Arthrobacter]MDT0193775.1 hypothetical protein [Arthrobacter sp. AB6]
MLDDVKPRAQVPRPLVCHGTDGQIVSAAGNESDIGELFGGSVSMDRDELPWPTRKIFPDILRGQDGNGLRLKELKRTD